MAGSCEDGSEFSGPIQGKGKDFVERVSDFEVLKADSAPCSQFRYGTL
jgi:hypothetical protein